ncbi:MAG TPA: DUF3159 domain-containing protein [Nocardioidaceae bacterium]|nr:DUF3159 domain-containing protein [Nocardioidaceae bacterium]
MSEGAPPRQQQPPTYDTVEQLVRGQLSTALGGRRGIAEGAVPTIAFTVCWIATHDLRVALGMGAGLAVLLLIVRLLQRQSVQFVLNSLVGIGIAAVFALRSGEAQDAFLPGIIYNAVYAVVLVGSVLVRWPVVGFLIGSVTGDPTAWHADKGLVGLCNRLTLLLALPCVLRVVVQYPLWLGGEDMVAWLGTAKLALGWPLQVAALAGMVWLLGRNQTPLAGRGPSLAA